MQQQAMDRFLAQVQNRAFVTAKLATGNEDEALDIVQDSMFKLVKQYQDKPESQWPALFQRVLQNNIRDWYRRQKVRRILFWWQQHDLTEETMQGEVEPNRAQDPEVTLAGSQINDRVETALKQLPQRQQQAFLLRAWWEYSTDETAQIMGCSSGSVKTHYSRATKALQQALQV